MPPRTRRNLNQRAYQKPVTKTNTIASAANARSNAKPAKVAQLKKMKSEMKKALSSCGESNLQRDKDWLANFSKTFKARFDVVDSPSPVLERSLKRARRSADEKENSEPNNLSGNSRKAKNNEPPKLDPKRSEKSRIKVFTMLVKDLRKELGARNLETTGLKKKLQQRLLKAIEQENAEQDKIANQSFSTGERSPESKQNDEGGKSMKSPFQNILDENNTVMASSKTHKTKTAERENFNRKHDLMELPKNDHTTETSTEISENGNVGAKKNDNTEYSQKGQTPMDTSEDGNVDTKKNDNTVLIEDSRKVHISGKLLEINDYVNVETKNDKAMEIGENDKIDTKTNGKAVVIEDTTNSKSSEEEKSTPQDFQSSIESKDKMNDLINEPRQIKSIIDGSKGESEPNGMNIDSHHSESNIDTVSALSVKPHSETLPKKNKFGNMLKATAKYFSPSKTGKSASKSTIAGSENQSGKRHLFAKQNSDDVSKIAEQAYQCFQHEKPSSKNDATRDTNPKTIPDRIDINGGTSVSQDSNCLSASKLLMSKPCNITKTGVISTLAMASHLHDSSSCGTKSINSSKKLQEKKQKIANARKARLEEMRGKSKTAQLRKLKAAEAAQKLENVAKDALLAAQPLSKPNMTAKSGPIMTTAGDAASVTSVCVKPGPTDVCSGNHKAASAKIVGTAATVSSTTAASSSEEEKRQLRAAKIREKVAAEAKRRDAETESKNVMDAKIAKSTALLHLHTAQENAKKHKLQMKISQSLPKQQKEAPSSPEPYNYEISDKEDSESESEENSYDERKPKKKYASWTKKEYLLPALDKQFGQDRIDPEIIFTDIETCNLDAIFHNKKSKYHRRNSSANWESDGLKPYEKMIYKRQMGFDV